MRSTLGTIWRTHPIRCAALIGAVAGFVNVLAVEIGGIIHKNNSAVVLMLWPTDTFAPELSQNGVLRTALILFIEFAGNMLADAILFAIPVAAITAILRIFRRRYP